jgi:2-polyprenyl-3-methyl-5-hydroxy-6-metoxy-1,4-benzoquinol methylase
MTQSDAERWNERYQTTGHDLSKVRPFLMDHIQRLPPRGRALDVAMGLGHNAGVLTRHGLDVIGVDISTVAIYKVRRVYPLVQPILCDLPMIRFEPAVFDVILNFWFLERDLFSRYQDWLKPGGYLFFETMFRSEEEPTGMINPNYFLKPGELLKVFGDWEILIYDESTASRVKGEQKQAVRFLAQKPA